MLPYVLLHKEVGQTPLQVLNEYKTKHQDLVDVPMAYAGRLDPMASGKLLVLLGDECKVQDSYHSLDKAYRFEVLFGTGSDTQDVLGLLKWSNKNNTNTITAEELTETARKFIGKISLPYPLFSSKTVNGKALHTWTLENRLNEIEIPINTTRVYKLICEGLNEVSAEEVYKTALEKINSIPQVTEASKALGRDFRRDEIRLSWKVWLENNKGKKVNVASFYCIASSGTYMRSLAEELGKKMQTNALAYSIDRLEIGRYQSLPFGLGFWRKKF